MQLQGTIKHIGKLTQRQGKDGKTYPTQKILLAVLEGNYSNVYPIDIHPKLQDRMDQYYEGQPATVHINMRGVEYVNKATGEPDAFLSFSAWKIEASGVPVSNTTDGDRNSHTYTAPSVHDDSLPF